MVRQESGVDGPVWARGRKGSRARCLHAWKALVASVIVPAVCAGMEAQPGELPGGSPAADSLKSPPSPRARNWLELQISHFRSFPHLDRAYRLLQQGRKEEAASEVQHYLRLEPHDLAARQTYLILLFQMAAYSRTVEEATLLLQDQPTATAALLYRALSNQRIGHAPAAAADFQRVAESETASSEDRLFAANSLVEIAIAAGRLAEARSALRLVARDSDNYELHIRVGTVDEALGNLEEADTAYRTAIQRASTPPERLRALLAAGELALRRGLMSDASSLLIQAHDLDPANLHLLGELTIAAREGGRAAEAHDWIRTALSLEPSRHQAESLENTLDARKDWLDVIEIHHYLLQHPATSEERYDTLTRLVRAYEELDRINEAASAMRLVVAVRPSYENLRQFAVLLDSAGQTAAAIDTLKRAAALKPSADTHSQLSALYEKVGNRALAIAELREALRLADNSLWHKRLGNLLADDGKFQEAAGELERGPPGEASASSRELLAELYRRSGDDAAQAAQLDLAIAAEKEPEERQRLLQQRGFLYAKLGDDQGSARAFQAAIEAGLDDGRIHMDLGFTLLRLKRWDEARDQFLRANDIAYSSGALFYAARCYQQLHQASLALKYLELAERGAGELDADTRKALFDELGYAQAAKGDVRAAAAAWTRSIAVRFDAEIAIQLAVAQRNAGQMSAAEATLLAMPIDAQTVAQRVDRAETLADIDVQEGKLLAAHQALTDGDTIQPNADRAYRMGLLAQQAGRDDLAIEDFSHAVAWDPGNSLYVKSLAYAYKRSGQLLEAVDRFKQALSLEPRSAELYRNLAYTQLTLGQHDEALVNLRAAIDSQIESATGNGSGATEEELQRPQEEYAALAQRFSGTVYESYRPHQGETASALPSGGLIPSQGGAEVTYHPLGFVGRYDDALQITGRVLWTNEPTGLDIDHDTLQGGLGVRYKPLRSADFYIGAERLIAIGSASQNDWLLRASFGLGHEISLEPGKSHWNYSQFYVDAGYFTSSRTTAVYSELNQGISLRASEHLVVTPHVVLVDHRQSPDPAQISLVEGGPGVLLTYLSSASRYLPHGPAWNLNLEYRQRFSGAGHSGWAVTTIFRF
jgi:tetratricopeptide (TPR) repeat protein